MANKSSSQGRTTSRPKSRGGRPAGLFTWIALGVVIVVVAALVIIKVAGGSSTPSGSTGFQAADPTTIHELTSIPASVFNKVGVTSPVVKVSPAVAVKGAPALTAQVGSKTLPEVFYIGGEYCPYCAAERWATIIALSRFGTWAGIGNMASAAGDYYPNTPTFTFWKASYSSKYLVFKSVEAYTNAIDPATNNYATLQTPTAAENALLKKYDTPKYIPGVQPGQSPIPFMSYGNKFVSAGSSYSPAALGGLTRTQIAAGLTNTSSPVTQAIIATANYQTAEICSLTKNQPTSVCQSPGVKAAKAALGLK